jgi:hypothetical protein
MTSNLNVPPHVAQFGGMLAQVLQLGGLTPAEFDGNGVVKRGKGGFIVKPMGDGSNALMVEAIFAPLSPKRAENEMAVLQQAVHLIRQFMRRAIEPGRNSDADGMVRLRQPERVLTKAVIVTVPRERMITRLQTILNSLQAK